MSDLALFGGEPVRKTPFSLWPRVVNGQKEKLVNTLLNDSWGIGSETIKELENKFAIFQDAKNCIAINTGTNALWVALKAAGVTSGDEVILPPYTFIATATAVLMANATPVFVDIDPDTFNIDPKLIESAITDRTKAIIPVHIGGNPVDMERIIGIANKYNLIIIEDAAQAHGAEWDGKKVGALHKGGIFSFQSSKNMSAGEGGVVVSNDEDFMDACFAYYNCGRHRDGDWYEHHIIGGNHRMSSMAASLLIPQFQTIENDMRIRDKNREKLDKSLSDMGLEITHRYKQVTREANHLYLLRYKAEKFNDISREKFFDAMRAEGVYTYAGYNPLYREEVFQRKGDDFPWLKNLNYSNISCPVTEQISDYQSVWLTQNHLLGDDSDIKDIINAFEKVTVALNKYPEKFDI
ncbi:MAG: DegT/DnrJ/EryC1/StrS family aminotransferase [Candidatus Neomarinimicrobiota bacterium]|nr:DegT/DnrJ/EryC1/StrS family aminotransferase [Candidatus Neomarinimicrobiota bacterium]